MSKQPFIPFEINLETFNSELIAKLDHDRKTLIQLLDIKEKSYQNFVKPFEMMDERLDHFFTPLSHLNSVNNSETTQKVYADALPPLTEYSTEIGQNLAIYEAFKIIKEREYASLNQEQQRVIDLNIQGFELSGAHLDLGPKERLKAINLRKSELTNDFSQNLLDATNAYELLIEDADDVKGLPQSDIEAAKTEKEGKTLYRFTLQMPSYIAYMTYGPNKGYREELYRAYTSRAPQNAAIIDELLALKMEMSQLLGFKSYAEYSIATKMAPTAQSVIGFLEELAINAHEQGQNELEVLKKMSDEPLESFDTGYYSEILKKEKYDIDEEAYRPYFEQNSVVEGMFVFLHRLFGVSFREVDEKLWDEKASSYDLYVDEKLRARIYLEARESKRGGAWMHNWQSHCRDENGHEQLASAFIVCNFPASTEENPSLLRHDDVVTLFHEMGHALHHMLSTVDENGVSGVNGVEWDAVEFPSQFLENFAYEPEVLRLFAKHHESNEILSEVMIEKLVRAKNFQSAMGMLRQLEFSIFDFKLHLSLYQGDEVQNLLDRTREKTSLIKPPSYNKFQNGFAHIFAGGYAAGYYSYKWAEVLSADAFFAIVDQGIFDTKLGHDYLNIILAKGGSQSMQALFKELLGREPQTQSLLRLNGIG